MGSSKTNKTSNDKEPKTPPATSQEQLSTTSTGTTNPDWSSFQAYSPIPPHGYLASNPHAHPYVWGVQHMMPPYGTPPPPHPYVAMYPPGGMYAHPSMPPGSYPFSPFAMPASNGVSDAGNIPVSMGSDAKIPEVKEKLPIKRSKGNLGGVNMVAGKNSESSKTPRNGIYRKSGESSSEDTSEGSDANSEDDPEFNPGGRRNSFEVYAPQNGVVSSHHREIVNQPMPISVAPGAVPGPTTNLNIGMDYWGAPTSTLPGLPGKVPSTAVAEGMVNAGSHDGVQSHHLDERELKRQRRKQSNRESARRSRLRKQAECGELAQRADALKEENASLRSELSRIKSGCEKLLSENAALKERLGELPAKEDPGSKLNAENETDEPEQTGQEEDKKSGH